MSGSPRARREHTIGRWLRDRARTTPDRIAIDVRGDLTTYRELDDRSERLAAAFLAAGLERGDRVATLTANSAEHVEVFWACAKAGLVLLPLNWRLSPPELAYQLADAGARALLVQPQLEVLADKALGEAAPLEPIRTVLTREELDVVSRDAGDALGASVADDDGLLLVYTSGTTGKPKGALLTHANTFWTNLSMDQTAGVHGDDVVLQVLPQFHVGGWNCQPLLAWWKGATVVLEPSFEPAEALDRLASRSITTMMGVPATYLFLAQEAGFADADLSGLRQAIVGGAPMPAALLRTWQDRDVAIVQGYGLTEAAPNVLCLPAEDAARKLGYAGKPYLGVEVALRDALTGTLIAGPGEGELLTRGLHVFAGYWGQPAATEAVLDADGWLATGDVAERDAEGFYRICDRTKDMYISGGENVYPAEVESVLHDHPDVIEAAVIGIADDRWGEVGFAAVVIRDDATADADALTTFCRERLATYKVPKRIEFVTSLPRSAMNKVLKTQLRDRFRGGTR